MIKGDSETQNCRFLYKIAVRLKKVCYKVSFCENCQRQSCKTFIGLTMRAKMTGAGRPLLLEILGQSDRVGTKSPIFGLFSLVAPQLTLIGSPLRAFQWAQDGHRTFIVHMPQWVAQKRKVSKIWTISCDNSETARDRMSVTINHELSIDTYSMTLNDLERRNSPYFAFFRRIRLLCWPITS